MKLRSDRRQRGVALLVVLILLVLMSVMAAKISQQFSGNLQRIQYQLSQQQLRWAILGADKQVLNALAKDIADPQKAGSIQQLWKEPLERIDGEVTLKSELVDGQNCFNVNSLLATDSAAPAASAAGEASGAPNDAGALTPEAQQAKIVQSLLTSAGINPASAETVYQQLEDYLGVENSAPNAAPRDFAPAYAARKPPRVPARQMMFSISELKLLPDFPLTYYAKVKTLLCALPATKTAINVNTLTRDEAPLLSALFFGSLTAEDVMRLIDQRPEAGWESLEAFKTQLEQQFPVKSQAASLDKYLTLNSQFYTLYHTGNTEALTLRSADALYVDTASGNQLLWSRRYRLVD
ncbi:MULTISPECIES: type II secretion system minor pseudopilin GspK [Franconibacter]|uniref:Type II secretion system protein K n=1 Tax=Franconibacter daqui TaxID=2047724 RepID=A0ABV1PL09_9ENTR|nr:MULTISPECIES: type II secretion system minor pseudopilin GspK [Franconibacter]MCK1970409.1 type II secretion system minor pseudopilin GspK [Franconibacter sp. IITDAS19]GGD33580.1 type II secretion system protein K [Franconibacter daqui]